MNLQLHSRASIGLGLNEPGARQLATPPLSQVGRSDSGGVGGGRLERAVENGGGLGVANRRGIRHTR